RVVRHAVLVARPQQWRAQPARARDQRGWLRTQGADLPAARRRGRPAQDGRPRGSLEGEPEWRLTAVRRRTRSTRATTASLSCVACPSSTTLTMSRGISPSGKPTANGPGSNGGGTGTI